MPVSRQTRAYGFALAAVLMWSTVASAFKLSLRGLDIYQLLFYASLVSALALLALGALERRGWPLARPSGRELARSALLGAINPLLYYLVLFKAYELLPAQQALILNYTWPIVLTLLSIPLLGQRPAPRQLLAIALAFAGAAVILSRGGLDALDAGRPLGAGLALGSTVVWAAYWLLNMRDPRDAIAKLTLNMVCGLVYALAAVCLFSTPRVPDWAALGGAAYVGVFEMGLTFYLWMRALELSENTARVGTLIYLAPVLSLGWIGLLVGEPITSASIAGLGLILTGLVLQRPAKAERSGA